MFPSHYFRSLTPVLLVFVLWGTTWPIGKIALRYFSPEVLVSLRFLLAGSVLAIYLFFEGKRVDSQKIGQLLFVSVLIGVFQYYLYYLFSYYALSNLSAGKASLIASSYPIMVFLADKGFWREKDGLGVKLIGLAVGIVGVAYTANNGFNNLSLDNVGVGEIEMLVATGALAVSTMIVRKLKNTYEVIFVSGVGMIISGVLSGLMLLFVHAIKVDSSPVGWGSLLYLVVVGTIVIFLLWNNLIISNPLSEIARFNFALPFFGVLFSFLILGEEFTWGTVVGGSLILVSLVLSGLRKKNIRFMRYW